MNDSGWGAGNRIEDDDITEPFEDPEDEILLTLVSEVYQTTPLLGLYQPHIDAVNALVRFLELDVVSSASRQHEIDTGRFLTEGEII